MTDWSDEEKDVVNNLPTRMPRPTLAAHKEKSSFALRKGTVVKAMKIEARAGDLATPMSGKERMKKQVQKELDQLRRKKEEPGKDDKEKGSGKDEEQYSLTFVPKYDGSRLHQLWMEFMSDDGVGNLTQSVISQQLNWSFRTSFVKFILFAIFQYFVLILGGTCFIMLASWAWPQCLNPRLYSESLFMGAFSLSWTTFSTVGYGHTYPQIGQHGSCLGISIITSVEAFVGVLFAGFVGAVLFGKIQTIYCQATVIFSDPCVVKYGVSLSGEDMSDDEFEEHVELHDSLRDSVLPDVTSFNTDSIMRSSSELKTPFPELTFRIANELYDVPRGEIMNLHLNGVAVIESHKEGKLGRKSYPPLALEPECLPLFERNIYVRHTLDTKSPLLTRAAKRKIRKNKGRWPPEFNNHAAIREQLDFSQISISLEGTSNISKSSVYAQKTYKYDEVVIGWKFVTIAYLTEDGQISLDLSLINDVVEQEGGGAEPIFDEDDSIVAGSK